MNNIINQLTKMKLGNDLIGELKALPPYNKNIRNEDKATRLVALSDIYNIYIPSAMSVEIYSKLYLALLHSLQKKSGLNARRQQNEKYKIICQRSYNSILGGSDSFTITGHSVLGKSLAIN